MGETTASRPTATPQSRAIYTFGQWFGRHVLFPPLFRVQVEGLENLPREGAAMFVANHVSAFDPIIIGTYLPRPVTYVAKRELVQAPILGWMYRKWGAVLVRRDGKDMPALRALLRVLQAGRLIGMFPEGTRSRDGVLRRPLPGAAYLAAKTGVPVVPIATWGAERLTLARRVREGRPPVRIRVGQPFTPVHQGDSIRSADLEALGDRLMQAVAVLLPPQYRGAYAGQIDAAPPTGG